ncbi:MAG: DUF72 domain-containing protein [Verrucomicrobiae bacterium]|nr:DUF72 domain-containing protein [Verrucomicrobiae bacterium]
MPVEKQLNFLPAESHPLDPLKPRLKRWAERGVYFGTSSWKYEGWLGQVYTRDRYFTRGKFSPRKFEQHCLEEYAECFPAVFGDFAFYQFYSDAFWQKLFAQVPPAFQFCFKAPELITAPVFPNHDRYGVNRGKPNENFLNADLFRREYVDRLAPYRDQVGAIVFQFPQFSKSTQTKMGGFANRLEDFLGRLPTDLRYGIELRTESLLDADYFGCLQRHRVAHTFNSWTRMPTVGDQLARRGSLSADVVVCRALLKPGRTYEEAVRSFSPYNQVCDAYPQGYKDVATLARTASERVPKTRSFIFVNNRFVGNAIVAISEILDELEKA